MMNPAVLLMLAGTVLGNRVQPCPNGCSGHGFCSRSTCTCFTQFTGADCSLRRCPSFRAWTGHADSSGAMHRELVECSNAGSCSRTTGVCTCQPGFSGKACEFLACPNQCSGRGSCVSLSQAATQRDDYTLFREVTYHGWEASRVFGCKCNLGYTGYDCSVRVCPVGDDPVTTGQVDEVQVIECRCDTTCSGHFHLRVGPLATLEVAHDSTSTQLKAALEHLPNVRQVDVQLTGGSTVCGDSSAVASAVTFTHYPGDVPTMQIVSSLSSDSGTPPAVAVYHSGIASATQSVATQTGTKERATCSGRGYCPTAYPGRCQCYANFAASDGAGNTGLISDCGHQLSTPTACPGLTLECSGHGRCSGSSLYVCTCYDGWHGPDCNERNCPSGKSWFTEPGRSLSGLVSLTNGVATLTTTVNLGAELTSGDTLSVDGTEATVTSQNSNFEWSLSAPWGGATVTGAEGSRNPLDAHYETECSNRGICRRDTGVCNCAAGFTGAACDRIDCPTISKGGKSLVCSGHGMCEPLWRLAELTRLQGIAAPATYDGTGGRDEWDFDMMYGCNCDAGFYQVGVQGYYGHDCSLRKCPFADDTSTLDGVGAVEVQTLICTGSGSGSFTASFLGYTSVPIAHDASAEAVRIALEEIGTTGQLEVSFSCGTTVCDVSGRNTVSVTFLTNMGDLPDMSTTDTTVSVVQAQSRQGTTDVVECGNHGLCDRTKGVCQCVGGFVGRSCDVRPGTPYGMYELQTTTPAACT